MKKNIENQTSKYNIRYQRRRRWYKILSCLSAIVVFVTTYALIIPAVTWEKTLICEKNEHIHSSSCYTVNENGETVLTCQKEEHIHGNECFDAPPAADNGFICGIPEHKHDDSCYFADGTLKCTLSEHIHSAECIGQAKLLRDETISQCEEIIQNLDTDNVQSVSDAFDSLNELYAPVDNAYFGEQSISETEYNSLCKVVDDYSDTVDALIGGTALGRIKLLADENPIHTLVNFSGTYDKAEYSANNWQITSGREGEAEYTIVEDGNNKPVLRLKKSILPAGTENEFYICLTVEPVFTRNLEGTLNSLSLVLCNSNNTDTNGKSFYFDKSIPTDINEIKTGAGINAHMSYLHTKDMIPNEHTSTQPKKSIAVNAIELQIPDPTNQRAYITVRKEEMDCIIALSSFTSGTLIYCAPAPNGGYLTYKTNTAVSFSSGTLKIPLEVYKQMCDNGVDLMKWLDPMSEVSFADNTSGNKIGTMSTTGSIITIQDYLGDYIKSADADVEIIANSGNDSNAEYIEDEDTPTINWSLANVEPYKDIKNNNPNSAYEYLTGDTDTNGNIIKEYYAQKNAYQLIYKVTLDTAKYSDKHPEDGLNDNMTNALNTNDKGNSKTLVQYKLAADDSTLYSAEFKSPTVKGALYSIEVDKKDSTNGNAALPGAVFALTDGSGDTVNVSLSGGSYVYDLDGDAKIISGSDGKISIRGLPTGSYCLKEISPPSGYDTDGDDEVTADFCYTEHPQAGYNVSKTIYNKEVPSYSLEVLKRSDTNSGASPLAGVQFGLYDGDNLIYTLTTNSSGIAALPDNIVLNCETEYTLVETKPPDNYFPPSDSIRFTVDEAYRLTTDTDAVSGYTDISISNKLLHITVINVQGIAELPATGGTGTVIIYTSGLLLISAAVLMFYCTLKEKRRHGGEH